MAQIKIVKFSELGTQCISTFRQFDQCHECSSVQRCKLPEAKRGRIRFSEIRFMKARLDYEKKKAQFNKVVLENT